MPNVARNILAVILALVVGSVVNMALVILGPMLIPTPAGVDATNTESLAAGIHLFEPKHFLFPFLAHALGTFVGAVLAFAVAATHRARFAWGIGCTFLLGGISAVFMIPAPTWFVALDLVVAYLPMAWLGIQVGRRIKGAQG